MGVKLEGGAERFRARARVTAARPEYRAGIRRRWPELRIARRAIACSGIWPVASCLGRPLITSVSKQPAGRATVHRGRNRVAPLIGGTQAPGPIGAFPRGNALPLPT